MSNPSPRIAALAAAGALALVLSACAPEAEPSPEPSPTASAAPIFASDEEALAAAVEAYEAYLQASNEISGDGGAEPERIDPLVTPEFSAMLHDEFDAILAGGGRLKGKVNFDTASLIEHDEVGGIAQVSIYLCQDVSDADLINSSGAVVTPAGRQERVPSQASFVSDAVDSPLLLVGGITKWPGEDFC